MLSDGAIIVISIGVPILAVLLLALAFHCFKGSSKSTQGRVQVNRGSNNDGGSGGPYDVYTIDVGDFGASWTGDSGGGDSGGWCDGGGDSGGGCDGGGDSGGGCDGGGGDSGCCD